MFKRHERRLVRLEYSFILFRVKITKLLPTSDGDVKLKQEKCTGRNQGQMNDALCYTIDHKYSHCESDVRNGVGHLDWRTMQKAPLHLDASEQISSPFFMGLDVVNFVELSTGRIQVHLGRVSSSGRTSASWP